MKQELLKGLTEEQVAKVKACKNSDELLALAKQEGVELTDEQLQTISGGGVCSVVSEFGENLTLTPYNCHHCGSNDVDRDGKNCTCKKCGHKWTVDD
jgi:bacteriocin-like protein